MGNLHVHIINNHGEVVRGCKLLLQKDEIVYVVRREVDVAPYTVFESDRLFLGLEPYNVRCSFRLELLYGSPGEVSAGAVVSRRFALSEGCLFHGFEPLLRTEALVGKPPVKKILCLGAIQIDPLGLPVRTLVPSDAKPFQVIQNGCLIPYVRSFHIRIFHAHDEYPSLASGVEIVKDRCSRVPYMEVSCGAWGEPDFSQ